MTRPRRREPSTTNGAQASAGATATGGLPSAIIPGGTRGAANADAAARTANGAQATAAASALGGSGQATAQAGTSAALFTDATARGAAAVASTALVSTSANVGGALSLKDSLGTRQAYAGITGLPKSSDVAPLLAGNPTVAATFGAPGYTTVAQGAMGGAYPSDGSGSRTYHSEIDLALDSTEFASAGTLSIGFLDNLDFGGFDSLRFTLEYEGSTVIDQTFVSLGAAEAFFDDTVHTIGAFVVGPELDIDIDFYFTGSKSGQGYGFDFLIGANAAFEPPNPIPEPGTLLVFASGLLVLLVSPQAAARLRRRRA